jgi:EmrB/QacA subfamily drug resistance transporter
MAGDRALENSTLIVATVTSFMGPFMISAVNVAMPAIQKEFSASAVVLSWIATAYLLATAVFLLPIGKIADIYGQRRIFYQGLFVFVLSSFLAAFSPSVHLLIVLRVIQGFGAAMLITTGMAIVTSVFPPDRRGRAIGIYVTAVYIGLSIGPTAGGALTHHFGWRSIFLVVVPLGLASIIITKKYLKTEWIGSPDDKFDLTGSILYGAALVALIYGGSLLPDKVAYVLIIFGLSMLILFVARQRSTPYPVFEVRLFQTNRLFTFSSLAALINYAATFAVTFLMSLYLQYIKGLNPQSSGMILVFQPVVMAIFSPLAGRLSDRLEPRLIATTGMGFTVLGLLQLAFINPETSLANIIAILVILGFGFALFSSPNMNAIMSAVEKKQYGIASGAVATMRLLGQMLSMAIATMVFAVFLGDAAIIPSNYDLFLKSLKTVFIIFTVMCTVGIWFSLIRGSLRDI